MFIVKTIDANGNEVTQELFSDIQLHAFKQNGWEEVKETEKKIEKKSKKDEVTE